MRRLTEKQFWDSIYSPAVPKIDSLCIKQKIRASLKRLIGEKRLTHMRSYRNFILWEVLYKKYMPKTGVKVLEVGSAPGDHLVRLRQTFGVDPYGVEYSEVGIMQNRQIFVSNNIDPNNVIQMDFFSDELHYRYKDFFDIVISRGFIEHFDDPESVIEKHINLLKNGGTFMISVPNFRGFNYFLLWFFQKDLLPKHNFKIMHKGDFLRCFEKDNILLLYCDYYGIFDFELFSAKNSWRRLVWDYCLQVQRVLNLLFRLIFRKKGIESAFFSPMLIAIGVKVKC